jgi:hypothetical protein
MIEQRKNQNLVGRLPSAGAGSCDPAYTKETSVSPLPSPCVSIDSTPRRLRRLDRVWPDRDGNIAYLLTLCVDERRRVLDNETIFDRLIAFLLDSPTRYHWFGRRFVIMPDHLHLIAHQGQDAVPLGQWVKALKAVVSGLERRADGPVGVPRLQNPTPPVGRVPSRGARFTGSKRIHPHQALLALADGFSRPQIPHRGKRIAQMGVCMLESRPSEVG